MLLQASVWLLATLPGQRLLSLVPSAGLSPLPMKAARGRVLNLENEKDVVSLLLSEQGRLLS